MGHVGLRERAVERLDPFVEADALVVAVRGSVVEIDLELVELAAASELERVVAVQSCWLTGSPNSGRSRLTKNWKKRDVFTSSGTSRGFLPRKMIGEWPATAAYRSGNFIAIFSAPNPPIDVPPMARFSRPFL